MTTIITKNGSGAPTAGQLSQGELAVDLTNKELYTKDSGGNVIKVGAQGGSTGTFTDLTATSSFTSPGIDDNATSTAVTIDASGNVKIATDGENTTTTKALQFGSVFNRAGIDVENYSVYAADMHFSTANNAEYGRRMTIASTGNVGIGVTDPDALLHVDGPFRQTGATAPFQWDVASGAVDTYTLSSPGYVSNILTATASGNVGIGESNPDQRLHVTGTTSNYGILAEQPSGYGGLSVKSTTSAQTWSFIASDNGADSDLLLYGGSSAGTKVSVSAAGNVGIGANPAEKLMIDGGDVLLRSAYDASGVTSSNIYFQNRGGGNWRNSYIGTASNSLHFATGGVGSDHTNAAIRMTVDATGNVGIGTLTPFGNARLQVKTGTDRNLAIQTGTTETTGVKVNAFDDAASVNVPLELNGSVTLLKTGEVEAARIDASGNLLVGTTGAGVGHALQPDGLGVQRVSGNSDIQYYFSNTSTLAGFISVSGTSCTYNSVSDARLKENIVDAPAGNIDAIRVRSFDWKADGSHQTYGVIAQELAEVAPEAVTQSKTWGVDYSKLVPMMIKEIQDLKAEVAALKGA